MARTMNSLVKCLNKNCQLPQYLVFLLNEDLLGYINLFDFGTKLVFIYVIYGSKWIQPCGNAHKKEENGNSAEEDWASWLTLQTL